MASSLLESLQEERKIDTAGRFVKLCGERAHDGSAVSLAERLGESVPDGLAVSRSDIEFFNVGADTVAIEIRVTNRSARPSPPAVAVMSAAPLGALVPWQPLVTLPVPILKPGEDRILRTRAIAIQPEPLGSPDSVPPRRLLSALGLAGDSPGEPSREGEGGSARLSGRQVTRAILRALGLPGDSPGDAPRQKERRTAATPSGRGAGSAQLPADLMQLLLQETPHWAGNINVHIGNTDVERHLGRALRVYPGRMNLAWFFVGGPGRDAYAFRLNGLGKTWDAKLFDMTSRESLVLNAENTREIGTDEWIPTEGSRTMLLAMRPPKDCSAGIVEVAVTQQSSGRKAVVEFSLDPAAAGRGCYVV